MAAPLTVNYAWNGYLTELSSSFDKGVQDLRTRLKDAETALATSPSDPTSLAQYQAAMSEYNLYRNAQTSAVKAMKDIDSAIISNFR